MMGWLKNKVHRQNDDLEDIRSSVLGNDFTRNPEPDFPRPDFPRSPPLDRGRIEVPSFDEPFRRDEPPGFSSIDTRFPDQPTMNDRGRSDSYDIIDRLNLIESQLSAIRSQTETINERLKNLETKLTRRY